MSNKKSPNAGGANEQFLSLKVNKPLKNTCKNYNIKSRFITAKEIAEDVHCSLGLAYKIIRELNSELKKLNKYTLTGKVSRDFYYYKTNYKNES